MAFSLKATVAFETKRFQGFGSKFIVEFTPMLHYFSVKTLVARFRRAKETSSGSTEDLTVGFTTPRPSADPEDVSLALLKRFDSKTNATMGFRLFPFLLSDPGLKSHIGFEQRPLVAVNHDSSVAPSYGT